MSTLGHKQTYALHQPMSALPPIATSIAFIGISALGKKRTSRTIHNDRLLVQEHNGIGPWSNFKTLSDADWVESAPQKRGENAYSSIDSSFLAFARRNLASGINSSGPSRYSPCSLQSRRRENLPRHCSGRRQNNWVSEATQRRGERWLRQGAKST